MKLVKVISGIYVGKIGWINKPNHLGKVIFYPIDEECPCHIRLSIHSVANL